MPNDPPYSQSTILHTTDASAIQNASPETIIVLYRGCNQTDAEKMRDTMTAGGKTLNEHCGPPSDMEVVAQVGEGQFERQSNGTFAKKKLPEFTHDPRSMMMDRVKVPTGVVMGVVQIWIRRRYIVRGDNGIMNGWCAKYEAPIERWEFKRR